MALPYAVEYLLTLRGPTGGRLVYNRMNQTIIPAMAGNTQLVYNVIPLASDYMTFLYRMAFGAAMVPNAFLARIQQWGTMLFSGVVTAGIINFELDHFIPVTQSEPTIVDITNAMPIGQYYELNVSYIAVPSEDTYNMILAALDRMGTSAKSEAEMSETNKLLREMLKAGGR